MKPNLEKRSAQKLRIIGGKWRSRKFQFPAIPGLRPTPDRVKETLFNWLSAYIPGARCADLFAGSGALGLEALSRGAALVEFYDASMVAIRHIQGLLQLFAATNAKVQQAMVPNQLTTSVIQPFDIIFLDPPFHQGLITVCSQWLETHHWLADKGFVYIEAEASLGVPQLPPNWQLLKQAHAGQLNYYLFQRKQL